MGVSDIKFDAAAGPMMDLSGRGIQKLDPNFTCSEDTHTLILDRNNIMKLDHLERSPGLQQLSVANNRLVRMMGVCRLTELKVLNLPNNSIGYIEGLRDMPHLKWLNLSGNNVKVIEQLNNCVNLQHLDLSDNNITVIGDLTKLVSLKTLLLHGNSITTLRTVPAHLPAHLSILSLAENEIRDLNEVSYLAPLHDLEQLSIMSNPCVMATPSLPGFDYRPYIMSWCLNLKVLDGYIVSQKEGLKAEWLYSQGKGRSYRPGQHVQLVQYLATVCPLTASPALETAEDAKLEKILSKQRLHQRQLLEENRGGCPGLPRPTRLNVEKHILPQSAVEGRANEVENIPAPPAATAPSVQETEPVVQYNTWVISESCPALPAVRSQRPAEENICLEDVQVEEDNLNSSILSSVSLFIPLSSDAEPQLTHSDSEDETETFDADSLAPARPAPRKTHNTSKTNHSPKAQEQCKSSPKEKVIPAVPSGSRSLDVRVTTAPKDAKTLAHSGRSDMKVPSRLGEAAMPASKSCLMLAEKAAVRIQSWWRGQHTRCCHPVAKEVRNEIRLRRMQEHIVHLSYKLNSVQKQYEEEKLQRVIQEEAVKFLWKELQSMQLWKHSVDQQLSAVSQAVTPSQTPSPAQCEAAPPVAPGTTNLPNTDVSFPDSGFQTNRQAVPDHSFLSSSTAESLKTVQALSSVCTDQASGSECVESSDCSLLEQYLSSVQQREEESEEVVSDTTGTPQFSSLVSPSSISLTPSPTLMPSDGAPDSA